MPGRRTAAATFPIVIFSIDEPRNLVQYHSDMTLYRKMFSPASREADNECAYSEAERRSTLSGAIGWKGIMARSIDVHEKSMKANRTGMLRRQAAGAVRYRPGDCRARGQTSRERRRCHTVQDGRDRRSQRIEARAELILAQMKE
jgi:hypothetical protein